MQYSTARAITLRTTWWGLTGAITRRLTWIPRTAGYRLLLEGGEGERSNRIESTFDFRLCDEPNGEMSVSV